MRVALLFLFILTAAFTSCKNRRYNFLRSNGREKYIVLQPLGSFHSKKDSLQLAFLKQEVKSFYNRNVVIAPPLDLPASFVNTEKGKRYSANAILKFLKARLNDTTATIAGITHEDIYTTVYDNNGNIKQPSYKYRIWGIFGLGYEPGTACVISDRRLYAANNTLFRHRERTVLLHEIGHNLGLPHCPTLHCIMSAANERISTTDNSGNDYCDLCKEKLK